MGYCLDADKTKFLPSCFVIFHYINTTSQCKMRRNATHLNYIMPLVLSPQDFSIFIMFEGWITIFSSEKT